MLSVTLDDLTETPDPDGQPWLDRYRGDARKLTKLQRDWRRQGFVILPHVLPDDLMAAYCATWRAEGDLATGKVPWTETAYMTRPAVRDLCLWPPLMAVLEELIGAPMALHLNLANWRSTRRDWHQDDYLNPPHVDGWYCAVWMALADVRDDAGPFEIVPGSHRWPVLRREKMLWALEEDGTDPMWPTRSEMILSPLYEAELERRGVERLRWLAKRGDVLIWHARAVHRGTVPTNPDRERRALISHYSAIHRRLDMPTVAQHGDDERARYFVLP